MFPPAVIAPAPPRTKPKKQGQTPKALPRSSEGRRGFGSVFHHHYSKSQLLSVGIFFACSPCENRNDAASVAPATVRFPARFPQISLSVISRDASARDATLFIFNDLQAAGSISNLVGRWGMRTAQTSTPKRINIKIVAIGGRKRPLTKALCFRGGHSA